MSISVLRLRGEALPAPPVKETSEYYTHEASYSISPLLRGDVPEQKIELSNDHIIELIFEDDTVWIGSRDTLDELFPEVQNLLRGNPDEWMLPGEVMTDELDRNLLKKAALKVLNLFVKKKVVAPAIKALAANLENKQLGALRGLCVCDASFNLTAPKTNQDPGHYLLFIHGTASSTISSFEQLKTFRHWPDICNLYKDKMLAFQHETLTMSPLENVLHLVKQLPAEATLDIISHSRGGLVADLLCRFCANAQGFGSDELLYLKKVQRTEELEHIAAIEAIIKTKNLSVKKLVRVACPAQGTTLAGKRLNTFFNITLNLVGVATGAAVTPVYIAFKEIIIAAIESKDDTEVLPGIEAMNPESPFIKVLNFAGTQIELGTQLMVIAGNSRMSLRLKGLLVLASKLFYTAANDLVVNTRSMYDGAKRQPGKGFYYLEQTATTNHFAYFTNESSQLAIYNALRYTGEGSLPDFVPLTQTLRTELERNALLGLDGGRVFRDEVTGRKPIVVLLPGIMGSNLMVKNNVVWINYLRFLTGQLTRLEYTEDNNRNIKAHSLIRTSYKKLADYLGGQYDVVTYPFDWRVSLEDSTAALATKLTELLRFNQPIKLIGHSMGGVLVRDFILYQPEVWKRLNATSGFRLLLLGSPLGGSFRIPYVLFGYDDIITKIAKLDIRNSKKDLLQVFCNLPGLHSLLPQQTDADNNFADPAVWAGLQQAFGDTSWPVPSKDKLVVFKKYRDKVLEEGSDIDYKNVIYIAGKGRNGKDTPCGYRVHEGKLEFLSTLEGDESVTWASGIPAALKEKGKVYYSLVTHGELANDPSLFGAITDVLERGETSRLRTTPPAVRSTEKLFVTRQVEDFDLSEEGVERTLLGLATPEQFKPAEPPIQVSITNGDLRYARYPVLAGHFAHDGILSSEKAIDAQLNGELSRRLLLGLHPGKLNENEVILTDRPPDDGFQGAIIVGLGNQGELTAHELMRTVAQGVAKYLTIINVKSSQSEWASRRGRIGISILAVAGSYGGLTLESSLLAVLTGIQYANQNVRRQYGALSKVVEEVEVIELYVDRALGAIYAVKGFERDENRLLNLVLRGNAIRQKPGRRERMPIDNTTDWWTRINVRIREKDKSRETDTRKTLTMTISSTGAREQMKELHTDSDTLQSMIDEMSTKNRWSPQLAKTMFELLIPNDLKDEVKRQSNINFILDKSAAAYPWELLQDTTGNALPLCVHAGMIRQLATQDYRLRIQPVGERKALVVADPKLDGYHSQLPGALDEGKMAYEILSSRNYETLPLLHSTASEIYLALFSNEYKIVHLAGHGVYDAINPAASGMLVGNKAYLTTAEFAQMSTTPELVFINCCYLGQVDATQEMQMQQRYKLAANIGTQLIENGVKAVVVTGWAVDDLAALDFADCFYKSLFGGNTFGDAVKKARRKVYDDHGHRSNTWGAYQCYGDPFYRLDKQEYTSTESYDFVVAEEVEIYLANLLYKMNTGNYKKEEILTSLSLINEAAQKAGLGSSKITERQARIYANLNMYEAALQQFELLKGMNRASYSFAAMEQYCNIRVKYIGEQADQLKHAEALKQLKDVVSDITALLTFGKTMERLSLLGSTWKRIFALAIRHNEQYATEALQHAAFNYHKAWLASDLKSAYPLANWLQMQVISDLLPNRDAELKVTYKIKDAQQTVQDVLDNYAKQKESSMLFWEMSAKPNLMLTQLFLGKQGLNVSHVFDAYKTLWDKAGHEGNKNIEIQHIQLLSEGLALSEKPKGKKLKAAMDFLLVELKRIKNQ